VSASARAEAREGVLAAALAEPGQVEPVAAVALVGRDSDSRVQVQGAVPPVRRGAAVAAAPAVAVRAAAVALVAAVRAGVAPAAVVVRGEAAIAVAHEVRAPRVGRPLMRVVRSATRRAGRSAEPPPSDAAMVHGWGSDEGEPTVPLRQLRLRFAGSKPSCADRRANRLRGEGHAAVTTGREKS